jgi:glucose-6-phosphate 1-epimerase
MFRSFAIIKDNKGVLMSTSSYPSIHQCEIIDAARSISLIQDDKGACLHIANQSAKAVISMHGAQLLSFIPASDNIERLWLSHKAVFDQQSAIRGGAPICWPWFGPHKVHPNFPAHGFVRTQAWRLTAVEEISDKHGVNETICRFEPNTLGLYQVSEDLRINAVISIGKQCNISLISDNQSINDQAISQAIHSYFALENIQNARIEGIDTEYYDKLNDSHSNPCPTPYIISEETDRVHTYLSDQPQNIEIFEGNVRRVKIEHQGNNAVVVWNPWRLKSQQMQDMAANDYVNMLCIEAATEPMMILKAGQRHTLTQCFC